MSRLEQFCDLCVQFERAGFDVRNARYWGQAFGSWSIEVARKGIRSRSLGWDGRDGLLIVEVQVKKGEWTEDWHTMNAEEQSFERIVARLT